MDTLKYLIQSKLADPYTPTEAVNAAIQWLQTELDSAELTYSFARHGASVTSYGEFLIHPQSPASLTIKIAELDNQAFAFADIHLSHLPHTSQFPISANVSSEAGKKIILHYIADFILSGTRSPNP